MADEERDFESRQVSDAILERELPTLHLEDVSAIPFVDGVAGVEQYQHRARVRAQDGDLFASTSMPAPGYEAYCRDRLAMGSVEHVLAAPIPGAPTQVARACMAGEAFEQLCRVAAAHDGLMLHPYMGIEAVWELAAKIEASAQAPVFVHGPTPDALWLANDKARLTELALELGLAEVIAETRIEREIGPLASALKTLAARHERVALKRTRCASAMGNEVFDSALLRGKSETELELIVQNFLARTQWEGDEDVLVVEWIDATSSPSSQLWVPSARDASASVRVDGLYEQLLVGEQGIFLGSMPSTLPREIGEQMAQISLKLCEAFRQRGYVGRCSFDFVIDTSSRARLTECNGRWGGTSSPMHLVDRVTKSSPETRPAYIAQDIMDERLVGLSFPDVLDRVGDELFDASTGQGRFLFYNVGPLTERGKLDVVSLGADPADAAHGVQEILPRLLGLG